ISELSDFALYFFLLPEDFYSLGKVWQYNHILQ
ncbi:unnamed protein product, partial [Urochloa humidicola]